MPVLGVIPARLGSTRLPFKPLRLLAGEPLINRVAERVTASGAVQRVVIATDSPAIAAVVERGGFEAVLTAAEHESGTARVAEVAGLVRFREFDLVLNVQGDEPFIADATMLGALARVQGGDDIGTAASPLGLADRADPNRVKVVLDPLGRATGFSRMPPANGGDCWQHVGVYAYRPETLRQWQALAPTAAEQAERLEQLRPLAHGMTIGVARLTEPAAPGIDTSEDLDWAEAHWRTSPG